MGAFVFASVFAFVFACRYHPILPHQVPPSVLSLREGERGNTRSPVNFREGRRSSDGLVAQGIVAFQQRLYDKEKAEEVVNLHQVREEARELAIKFGDQLNAAHNEQLAEVEGRTTSYHMFGGVNKRTSLPENLAFTSSPRQVALQQQLLQHRLQQKRQNLQKQRLSHGEPLSASRHRSGRQSSGGGKLYFQTDVIPPPPTDFHFQPIAEDEPGPDPSPHSSPGRHGGDSDQAWIGLPSYMQAACRVTERSQLPLLGSPFSAHPPPPFSPYYHQHIPLNAPPTLHHHGPYQNSPTRELAGSYQNSPTRDHGGPYQGSPSRELEGDCFEHFEEGAPR